MSNPRTGGLDYAALEQAATSDPKAVCNAAAAVSGYMQVAWTTPGVYALHLLATQEFVRELADGHTLMGASLADAALVVAALDAGALADLFTVDDRRIARDVLARLMAHMRRSA